MPYRKNNNRPTTVSNENKNSGTEKIHKVLATCGLGSRREIEDWLREGRIAINGTVAKLGDRMLPGAQVRIDGRPVHLPESSQRKTRVLLYHKPEGQICSRSDPKGRPTVFDRLPPLRTSRWISVGRLDFNTAGLLLFTNNGELANQLMHPSANLEREYAVRIQGDITPETLMRVKKGVKLEDGMAHFESVIEAGGEGSNRWYHVTVREGRNRLVRRLWESQGASVSRLIRIRFGALTLPRMLPKGRWAELTPDEIAGITAAPPTSHKPQKTTFQKTDRKRSPSRSPRKPAQANKKYPTDKANNTFNTAKKIGKPVNRKSMGTKKSVGEKWSNRK